MDRQVQELATEVALADQAAERYRKAWEAEKLLHKNTQALLEIERRKTNHGYYLGIAHSLLAGAIFAAIYWVASS